MGANASTKDLIDAQYNLEYLVYSTRRFGVEFSKKPIHYTIICNFCKVIPVQWNNFL